MSTHAPFTQLHSGQKPIAPPHCPLGGGALQVFGWDASLEGAGLAEDTNAWVGAGELTGAAALTEALAALG